LELLSCSSIVHGKEYLNGATSGKINCNEKNVKNNKETGGTKNTAVRNSSEL